MSNTVIRNLRDASGRRSGGAGDAPLVVLLDKDGTITLDERALRGLVEGDGSQTSSGINVVRMLQDGKPDDATDSDSDDEGVPHVTLTVDGFYDDPNGIAKYDSGIEMLQSLSNETREYSLIGFHNDHCYTSLTSPNQTVPSHSSNLASYNEAVSEELPSQKQIPSSKKITILEQQIIPKGKKIVINTTEAPVILKGSDVLNKPLPGLASKVKQTASSSSSQVETVEGASEQSESEESSEESVNDRDSDSDYTYSRDPMSPVKSKKSRLSRRTSSSMISKKIGQLKNVNKPSSKTKPSKSLIRQDVKDKIQLHNKSKLLLERRASEFKKQVPVEPVPIEPPKLEQKLEMPKLQKIVKKEKKTPAHVTALLSDMTTLFSAPDVIRRVSTDTKYTPTRSEKSNVPVDNQPKQSQKTYSKPKDRISLTDKMVKEFESIPQIDEASLAQLLQDTPVITTSISHGMVSTAPVVVNPLSSPNLLGSGLVGPLSPTLDLLAGLQPEEEGLTEDLLMHVAQLVENDENLQEVIDKQVLGKVDSLVLKPPLALVPKPVQPVTPTNSYLQKIAAKAQQKAAVLSNKNPIQIVRSDGRVITLPPIEAPATRSSKRKSQGGHTPQEQAPATPEESKPEVTTQLGTPKQYSNKKAMSRKPEQTQPSGSKMHPESDDSLNSEDDPYRLWCICKQPHNNRFMICCDKCEDWFHGKCVNITKVMGQQMEEQGVEWTCPKCKKNQTPKPASKPGINRRSLEGPRDTTKQKPAPAQFPKGADTSNPSCIVCSKPSRASSIYCSDTCILKHAQESLPQTTATAPKNTDSEKSEVAKPKGESRVIVFERKTGRCLAGANAPTADNLESWLQEHPTFEVVRPGTLSTNKPMVNVKKTPPAKQPQKVQTTLKFDKSQKQIVVMPPQSRPPSVESKMKSPLQSPQHEKSKSQEEKLKPKEDKTKSQEDKSKTSQKQATPVRPSPGLKQTQLTAKVAQLTSKQSQPSPKQIQLISAAPKTPVEVKKTPAKVTPVRTQPSVEKTPPLKSPPTPRTRREREPEPKPKPVSVEPIRENVRKALQEHMSARFAEMKGSKFTEEEIKKFALQTESELHGLFKDVGVKYKAKYRSLIFNIKDRKNLSLWQKICDKNLTPKQLVRLSPEELASQELAQWRDKEAKHQLELIKKNELDLLTGSKTYVLKTHKGEEVMEAATSVQPELDPDVSVQDLVTALNDSNTEEPAEEKDSQKHTKHKGQFRKRSPSRERSKHTRSSGRNQKEEKTTQNKKRKDDPKSKSKPKDRKRSHSRERTRSRHRSRSKQRSRSKYKSSSRERIRSVSQEDDHRSKDKYGSKDSEPERPKSAQQREIHPEYDPHEPMITSAFSEEDLRKSREDVYEEEYGNRNLIDATATYKESSDEYNPARVLNVDSSLRLSSTSSAGKEKITSEVESDQEPSSTVDTSSAPVWSGCINMVDVARFYVGAHEVSGNGADLEEELSADLDIVGRINPETVWDYISKMKRAGNKDIVVLRLTAANDEERMQYIALYTYLHSRNRLGVVKVSNTMTVKDFYIFPLASSSAVPPVLLPLDGPGLDDVRNHLLVAIIVRQRKKRAALPVHKDAVPAKISKSSIRTRSYTPPVPSESYTPPRSPAPTRASARLQLPLPFVTPTSTLSTSVKDKIAASLASAEDEEAYSPGSSGSVTSTHSGTDTLRTKMDELNRQIEEQKQQIMSMSAGIHTTSSQDDEAYSPSRPMTPPRPGLADIALPSNLQEILDNIQQRSAPPPPPPSDVDMRLPPPPPPPPPPPQGKLHALSEEELLRMVPDDAN